MRAPTNHPSQLNDFVNGRILAIDDTQSIHEDYRKVLLRKKPTSTSSMTYQIDSALQGEEGLELVKQSLAYNTPYATAFIDIRMPPGWDGIETAQKIWEVDPLPPYRALHSAFRLLVGYNPNKTRSHRPATDSQEAL